MTVATVLVVAAAWLAAAVVLALVLGSVIGRADRHAAADAAAPLDPRADVPDVAPAPRLDVTEASVRPSGR